MEKRLPVEYGTTPYGYVCANLEAVKDRFIERMWQFGKYGEFTLRFHLQQVLGTVETLQAIKEGFERNGWGWPGCGVSPQKKGQTNGTQKSDREHDPAGLF